jgi:hypothetical protein
MFPVRRSLAQRSASGRKSRHLPRMRPCLESLESRMVLSTATGNAWPNPQLITISFMPDGSNLGGPASNLFSVFNSKTRLAGAWQNQILKAAQVWAQQTNINFTVVPDNGMQVGAGHFQQGDPGFGDIRIGGYNFGYSTLAWSNQPPPVNNFSIAGDIAFNSGQGYNIGTTFDLFTVAAHEFGHVLGLGHSTSSAQALMYVNYNTVKPGPNADDIANIVSVYGTRSPDGFDATAPNGSFGTSTNLNPLIDPYALTALVTNLDITTTSDLDYYTFSAPAGTNGTLTVNVQSSGLSLLAPKVTVYAFNQTTVLGTANGLNQYGTTLSVTTSGISVGQIFYVKVQGADTTAFGTGAYAMTLNFGNNASPTVPLPQTQVPNGSPLQGGGGIAYSPGGHDHQGEHSDGSPAAAMHGHPQGPSEGTQSPSMARIATVDGESGPTDLGPATSLTRPVLRVALGLSMLLLVVAVARKFYRGRRGAGTGAVRWPLLRGWPRRSVEIAE